ncbi:MAG: ribosome recycling factor [Proteobacteria bacterium]|nr:ribosome recycling factor [Pseudomonadota bacterium]MBU1387066.1 ribosome recycling factor [Pseudomonadota bacterium]MBU1541617.1 ribosome recycling factor [Pseudomonadota bacterium]MBU2429938.1 ribosome recycling factor [Pseudomonadota bacterium]MBU2479499.1 ribosome recycling factor [Pseudomonadota bacterium]
MINEVIQDARDRMGKSEAAFEKELSKVRTGRASQSMLDSVKVDYYGTQTPLPQMATVSIPESRLITVKPWDISVINEVEKAIFKANLGLTPSNDGKMIRISIPPLTEERRKEIVKTVARTCEDYKVAVRNIRRDANEMLKDMQKEGDISEDEFFSAQKQVQEYTDENIKKLDQLFAQKEKEILEV